AEGLEHGARRAGLQPLPVRHFPHPLRRDRLDPLLLPEPDRRLVPGLPRADGRLLNRAHLPAPAAAADEDAAGVARLARGDVPLQQPAAGGARADDPLGRPLSDPLRCSAWRDALGLEAVLRLLPPHVRFATAAAD